MNNIHCLTVYLGSSGRCRPVFKDAAKMLGHAIGARGKELVYGGMDAGLMGIVANNALESGARVTGIIPKKLKDSERIHPRLSETILVPDLWERKLKMFQSADAIIALPGGFGTIDEALEALYWGHLGSHAKPVVFLNVEGYWDEFLKFIRALPDLKSELLIIAENVEEIFDLLGNFSAPPVTGNSGNLPHFEGDILGEDSQPMIFEQASIRESYILATALGLKQLDKHTRPIGIRNTTQYLSLLKWIDRAEEEHFITDRCKLLFSTADTTENLREKIISQDHISIDLNSEKWGPSETGTHIEIREKK